MIFESWELIVMLFDYHNYQLPTLFYALLSLGAFRMTFGLFCLMLFQSVNYLSIYINLHVNR